MKKSLRLRFIMTIGLLFIAIATLTAVISLKISRSIVDDIGRDYSKRILISQRSELLLLVEREMALTSNLVSSPMFKAWCLDEDNPTLKKLALDELDNYKRSFRDANYFFAIRESGHYYYDDANSTPGKSKLKYTLSPNLVEDGWFYDALQGSGKITLNLDDSKHLGVTKIWINAPIRIGDKNVGIAGTGLNLTGFIKALVDKKDKSTSTILFDNTGELKVHPNTEYMRINSKAPASSKITIGSLIKRDSDRATLATAIARAKAQPGSATTFEVRLEGRPLVASMAYIKELGWFALVTVDSEGFLGLKPFIPALILLLVSLLLVASMATAFVNQMVLRPLARLTTFSQAMAKGDYSIRMESTGDDEIGLLTDSFSQMASTIDDYTKHLEEMVVHRTAELERTNQAVNDSIAYARLIQTAMLPNSDLLEDLFQDHFAIWKPRDTVGGDIYVVEAIGDRVVIAVIDCTGHGVPGAFMSMAANAVLQETLSKNSHKLDPAHLLGEMNKGLKAVLHKNSTDDVDNGVDMGLLVYDPKNQTATYAGARLSLYVGEGGAIREIKGNHHSLGYKSSKLDYVYRNVTFNINLSDEATAIYMTTDGMTDQPGGPQGFCLGKKAFTRCIIANSHLPMAQQMAALEELASKYMDKFRQRDDITVLGFKFK